eukprot:558528-Lingulodinium_polyedra.AAC.1
MSPLSPASLRWRSGRSRSRLVAHPLRGPIPSQASPPRGPTNRAGKRPWTRASAQRCTHSHPARKCTPP